MASEVRLSAPVRGIFETNSIYSNMSPERLAEVHHRGLRGVQGSAETATALPGWQAVVKSPERQRNRKGAEKELARLQAVDLSPLSSPQGLAGPLRQDIIAFS